MMKIIKNLIRNRRLSGLIKKEFIQIKRDPSSILIAFLVPFFLTILFGNSMSFDPKSVSIGVVVENQSSNKINSIINQLDRSKYLHIKKISNNRKEMKEMMDRFHLRAILIIPYDFDRKINSKNIAEFDIVADASEPNNAITISGYIQETLLSWINGYNRKYQKDENKLVLKSRYWYNDSLEPNYILSVSIISMVIAVTGTLLTALVVAREWERGTMESLIGTPVSIFEILTSKLVPYFILCCCSFFICFATIMLFFYVPFKGSYILYFLINIFYCFTIVSVGILISISIKNQFSASQMAFLISFMPSIMLSGIIYDINNMPRLVQFITYLFSARHIVSISQTMFMVGNEFLIILKDFIGIVIFEFFILSMIIRKAKKKL